MHNKHFTFEYECTFSPICWRKVIADGLDLEISGSNPVIYVLCSYFTSTHRPVSFVPIQHRWVSNKACTRTRFSIKSTELHCITKGNM